MFAPAGTSATLFLVASWRGSHFKLIQYSVLKKKKIEQHHSFDFYKFSPEVEECSFEHQSNSIQIEESTSCGGIGLQFGV